MPQMWLKGESRMKVLLRKSIIPRTHNGLLEWNNPQNGTKRWYPINSKNVKPQPDLTVDDPFECFAYWRQSMNKISQGFVEVFSGDYDTETKTLKIKKL
jgi:hypothetical protein